MTISTSTSPSLAHTAASIKSAIAVAYGDGIGPEIMSACLRIMEAAGAALEVRPVDIGEKVYLAGHTSGITPDAWATMRQTRAFFKAPITTPQGKGYKSLNVTVRKALGLYANVRPCIAYAPFIQTAHPLMDVVIVRENEEDLYAGIEHRQSDEVYQCLKLVSRPGCEKIIRYAFEYARANNRRKVSCFTKDNIMKMTDGLFHRIFDEIRVEYPDLESDHYIIDIGAARLADTPEQFDVIVTLNLYGDVISDIAAQITGSVGLAGSANIGASVSMFEAIHGTAPDIAGKDIANPSGLLHAGIMMLNHLGQPAVAERIHNAWLRTIETGIHTADIYHPAISKQKVGTVAFAEAVIANLGKEPEVLPAVRYSGQALLPASVNAAKATLAKQELVGVDVFLDHEDREPARLGTLLEPLGEAADLNLVMITNRGVKVWPESFPETFCTDHWRCRFMGRAQAAITHQHIINLLRQVSEAGLNFIKIENLCTFDGEPGFSMGHGQ